MSETIEVCPCRCHIQSGHFHCFTPACCESVNRIGEFLRPKRVYEEFKPDPNSFKTFTFPMIKQIWPKLINADMVSDNTLHDLYQDLGKRLEELINKQAKELVEEESEDGLEAGP